jgi:hypothetical protein
MSGFEFLKDYSSRACFALLRVRAALPNSFFFAGAGSNVQQALVGLGVMHDGSRLALDRQNDRAFALPQLLDEIAGARTKGC